MPDSTDSFNVKLDLRAIFIGVAITSITVFFLFRLWDLHPQIPVVYSGDALNTLASLRNMRFGNWYWTTDKLGAPFGQDLRNFPDVANNLHLFVLWTGIKIFRNEFLVFNSFFFGSYLLTTISGFIGSRILQIQRTSSLFIGVTYSFLPYHYLQGPNHLTLAAYWAIPIWVAFLLRELLDDSISPFTGELLNAQTLKSWVRKNSTLAIALTAIIATTTGLYYGCFFIVLTSFIVIIRRVAQSTRFQWVPAASALGIGVFSMVIQYFPIWNYQRIHGTNLSIVQRTVAEVEFYSLKISNLLLPVAGHRLSILNHLQLKSNPVYLVGEGSDSLGILGSIGFIGLVCVLFFRLVRHRSGLPTALATFTLLSVFTCIVGGLAQFIAVLGFTQLRVMSRMSIVIAYPSVIFAVLLVTRLVKSWSRTITTLALTAVIILSVLDTNPSHLLPPFESTSQRWRQDQEVVQRLEQIAGENKMILQLPQMDFPEGSTHGELSGYEHLRGYLHSSTLRWSYGNIKSDTSDSKLVTDPFDSSDTKKLQNMGFSFIWFNSSGYGDSAEIVKNEIEAAGNQLEFTLNGIDVFRIGNDFGQIDSNGS